MQVAAVATGALFAALCDLRSGRIPNALSAPMLLAGLVCATMLAGPMGLADAMTAAILVGAPYVVLYAVAGGGAGDAKIMAALGAWLGVVNGLIFLAAVAAAGIVVAVGWAIARGRARALVNNLVAIALRTGAVKDGTVPHRTGTMPYGLAVFGGAACWS